jgi:cell pole-organizing protein PopZ
MSQPAKLPEPSIDEILASIRRSIVPDDNAGKPAARKPASRKQAAAAVATSAQGGAKVRRTNADALRANPDAAGNQGERTPDDSGTRDPIDGPPPLKHEARIPEGDSGLEGADNDSGDAEAAAAAAPVIPLTDAMAAGESRAPVSDARLLSPRTSAAVDTAFNSLAHTVLSQNPRTLEDLVREMLKPMLKAWLDANLPDMVERMVRAEIERLSRRG